MKFVTQRTARPAARDLWDAASSDVRVRNLTLDQVEVWKLVCLLVLHTASAQFFVRLDGKMKMQFFFNFAFNETPRDFNLIFSRSRDQFTSSYQVHIRFDTIFGVKVRSIVCAQHRIRHVDLYLKMFSVFSSLDIDISFPEVTRGQRRVVVVLRVGVIVIQNETQHWTTRWGDREIATRWKIAK